MESGYRPSELWKRSAKAHKKKKRKKNSSKNKNKKKGGINELAIILQNFLNSSFPGRDVWGVGGGSAVGLAQPWPSHEVGRESVQSSTWEALSQGNQRMVHYVLSLYQPPQPLLLYFAICNRSHTQTKPVSSISSLTMRPHVECLAAPSPSAPLTMLLDKCNCSPVFYLLGNFDWSINLKAFRLFRHKYFAYDKLGDWEKGRERCD